MSVGTWYLRWRHSKGFGVHSPYAYRFVVDVLRPGPYGYYCFDEIDSNLEGNECDDHKFLNLIRFTIRLASFLKAGRILTGESQRRLGEVVARSMGIPLVELKKDENVTVQRSDLLIFGHSDISLPMIGNAIERRVQLFAIDPDDNRRKLLETPLEHGLLFNDRRKLILIPRDEMAYVAYPVFLKPRR